MSISKSEWRLLADDYLRAVTRWTKPFRKRRRSGQSHPIEDFLFVYYQYSSVKLEQWHPGVGVVLEDVGEHDLGWLKPKQYRRGQGQGQVVCDASLMQDKERSRLAWTIDLLQQTQDRKPNFSCLGLHEWAMVYRGQQVRHEKTTKLRLAQAEIDQIVESRPLTCTHFDAFRFYAIDAKPLNRTLPVPDVMNRPDLEQPACIHANMDLYKWAFKAMPWIGSEILYECFELAMEARAIDMRASPYDLSEYMDYPPIKIETATGRAEYEREQRLIAQKAGPLRDRLKARMQAVLESPFAPRK